MSKVQVKHSGESVDLASDQNSLIEWQKFQLSRVDSQEAVECLLRMWKNFSYLEAEQDSYCDGFWDNVDCWPPTKAGSAVIRLCSEVLRNVHPEYTSTLKGNQKYIGKVTRSCLANGSWADDSETIYDECLKPLESFLKESEEDAILAPIVQYVLFFGSLLSLLCLSVSLAIFSHYRCLRCDRVTVQTQLILSLVLRFIMMIIITNPFMLGYSGSYSDVDTLCKAGIVLFLYGTLASVTWMFIQGLYLNVILMTTRISVRTQQNLKTTYFIIGWVVPAGFVSAFVITLALKNRRKCWQGYSKMSEMWILLGPAMFELLVNGLFLCNILRILVMKLRNSNTRPDSFQIKAAAKAATILFLVLGLNNFIVLYNPGGEYNKYFVVLNTIFGSTQGIFVAVVYCFTNKEVIAAIRRSIQRAKARRLDIPHRDQNNDQPPAMCMMELQETLNAN